MQNSLNSKPDDEFDLRELFIFLWAYKLLIVGSCVLGILIGFYNVQNTHKTFTSSATFKLDTDSSMGFSFGEGNLGPLANLAGIGSQINNLSLPLDKVSGRIFIQKIDAKLSFKTDPYFNTYNPNSVDPVWKSYIKRIIGLQKPSNDAEEAIWQSIVGNYSRNIALTATKEGSAKVVVTHVDPQRAAEIANGVMNTIITTAKIEKIARQEQRLAYLSNTLAKALGDLEMSQSNLKEFTLANSALPLENFAAGSLALDSLREQLKRTTNLHEAVAELSLMLKNKTVSKDNYLELRQKFPIVDQVEFRRILGQNEIISSWTWPDASSVEAVFDTLSERISRLQSKIVASQKDAERSGLTLETYAKLERNAKIAEATYTVLIEQVKAQSISAGYQPDNSEVYEYASAPINPSSPKRNQVLSAGAILGLFVGIALSCIMALLRGVHYSKRSLKSNAQAHFTFSIRSLLHLRNTNLDDLNRLLIKKPSPILRDVAVEIHKSTERHVVVTSSRSKLISNDVARALAIYMQSETMKIAIIDFSSKVKKLDIDEDRLSVGSFVVAERTGHISALIPDSGLDAMELLSQKDFLQNIHSLNSTFDLVFLCADGGDAISLLSTFERQKMFHITLARIKKTKSATLTQMRSRLPIQGLLHD
jgi:uncharacterized protein involved in exopolysaccharide biosynthesis